MATVVTAVFSIIAGVSAAAGGGISIGNKKKALRQQKLVYDAQQRYKRKLDKQNRSLEQRSLALTDKQIQATKDSNRRNEFLGDKQNAFNQANAMNQQNQMVNSLLGGMGGKLANKQANAQRRGLL